MKDFNEDICGVCKVVAFEKLDKEWEEVSWQGAHSYTLCNRSGKIVLQFRKNTEQFDKQKLELAKFIHPALAPTTTQIQSSSRLPGLTIWELELLPGNPHLFHLRGLDQGRIMRTVEDFARFFAASWAQPQTPSHDLTYQRDQLALLLNHLPKTFEPTVLQVIDHLYEIKSLPWVLTHNDLSCGNILTDPDTGRLTGIVDWADVTILPFGMALWSVQELIGFTDASGYHYRFPDAAFCRKFGETFIEEVGISNDFYPLLERARLAGVLLSRGFRWSEAQQLRIPISSSLEFSSLCTHLDARIFP